MPLARSLSGSSVHLSPLLPALVTPARFQRRRYAHKTSRQRLSVAAVGRPGEVDVVMSSGFLAFAKHAGFLKAVSESGLEVRGVMGTSSGAFAGSLFCAGYSPEEIAGILCEVPPIQLLRPNWQFWKGLISLELVVEKFRGLLPPTFEDLEREFALGIVDCKGQYRLINSGPLPEAVVASGAIPVLFAGVDIPGLEDSNPCADGGMVDRIGLKPWRDFCRTKNIDQGLKMKMKQNGPSRVPDAIVHVISRSSPFSGEDDLGSLNESRFSAFYSQKSGMNFFDLGDYTVQMSQTCEQASGLIARAKEEVNRPRKVAAG